jgi:hypothetical protein
MSRIRIPRKGKAARVLAWALVACFIATLFGATAFVAVQSRHTHDSNAARGECSTCEHVHSAMTLIKSLSAMGIGLCLIRCGFLKRAASLASRVAIASPLTSVTLKVRLNN